MKEINASIITIGDELLIGQTIDTNSAFIATELNKIGVWVKRRVAVGDVKEEILNTIKEQSRDCQLVIITGGLGPTADDITKPALCEYFGSNIIINEEALQNVKNILSRFNRPIVERNYLQAEVPDNCVVLQNKRGTAPGMWFEKNGCIVVSLPGVPHEMQGFIIHDVIPKIKATFTLPVIVHKTLFTAGQGESWIAEKLISFEQKLPSYIKLAYLPSYGMVRLRLTAKGGNEDILQNEVDTLVAELKEKVKEWLVAEEDISLQEAVIKLLSSLNKQMATAESCTGGYIAHLITSVAGSSQVYNGSVVSYANEAKENILDVPHHVLLEQGAVSEGTVTAMAKGIIDKMKVDYAVATSGIMGPGGGSKEKPVGTVWVAVASKNKVQASKHHFRFDRKRNIEVAANFALIQLRNFIIAEEGL